MGLVPGDVKPHPVVAEDSPEWADMSPEQRAKSARAMECFAGMVECVDFNVGKVSLSKQHIFLSRYPAVFRISIPGRYWGESQLTATYFYLRSLTIWSQSVS